MLEGGDWDREWEGLSLEVVACRGAVQALLDLPGSASENTDQHTLNFLRSFMGRANQQVHWYLTG